MATSITATIKSMHLRSGAEHELIRLITAIKTDLDAKDPARVIRTAAGGAAGTHTVTGLAVGDIIVAYANIDTTSGIETNRLAELVSATVTVANQCDDTGGTASTFLRVTSYTPYTATVSA